MCWIAVTAGANRRCDRSQWQLRPTPPNTVQVHLFGQSLPAEAANRNFCDRGRLAYDAAWSLQPNRPPGPVILP